MKNREMRISVIFLAVLVAAAQSRTTTFRSRRPDFRNPAACRWRNGGCGQRCLRKGTKLACLCYRGFRLSANRRTCIDVDECRVRNGGCQHSCTNLAGSYRCTCRQGYGLDSNGRTCSVRAASDPCGQLACDHYCVSSARRGVCRCLPGYRLHGNATCHRMCSHGNGGCDQVCREHNHRARCWCHQGYSLQTDRHSCTAGRTCAYRNGGCEANCEDTPIGVQCSCPAGFIRRSDRTSCQDVDECAANGGNCMHHCRNTQGSFHCTCDAGYRLARDERSCVDIDECLLNDTCSYGCVNSAGSYHCTCPQGFQKYAVSRCGDTDECAISNGGCAHNCKNTRGSHECSCRPGFRLHWNGKDCIENCAATESGDGDDVSVKCRGRACLVNCTSSHRMFRAFNPMLPGFTYICGQRSAPRYSFPPGCDKENRLLTTASAGANLTSCEAADANRRVFYSKFCISSDFCHLERLRSRNVVGKVTRDIKFLKALTVTCFSTRLKRRRKTRSKIIVEVELHITIPGTCTGSCAADKLKSRKKSALQIKQMLKKQQMYLAVASGNLRIRKRTTTKGRVVPGIRTTTGCLLGTIRAPRKRSCDYCARGQYFDVIGENCVPCPTGSYQNKLGQLDCNRCPADTSGGVASATNIMQCHGNCQPGHYSASGATPCQECPVGSYQSGEARIGCDGCGEGISTRDPASTSFDDCVLRVVCSSGHFYNMRTATCARCPSGFYQHEPGKNFCFKCPGNTTTDYDASASVMSCKDRMCGGELGELHGVIESPNYPGEYPINSFCKWTIQPPKKRKILIVVPEIFLPAVDNCSDYLVMKKKANTPPTYQFCQTFLIPSALTARARKFRIEFRSNGQNGSKGFQIPYVTYDENYDQIIQNIIEDGKLYNPDYHQNILKDKRTREALFEVLAKPEIYFKYTQEDSMRDLFPRSFIEFLREKVARFFSQ